MTEYNKRHGKGIPCKDHLGNTYPAIKIMCQHYDIKPDALCQRLRRGWSLERALTTKTRKLRDKDRVYTDHLGNVFPSIKDMCKYHGIKLHTYEARRKRGLTKEEALKKPLRQFVDAINDGENHCVDHLGNTYSTLEEMCKKYNISTGTFRTRIKSGWSLDKALTTEVNTIMASVSYDHLGNMYKSKEDMCQHYGIEYLTYRGRIRAGWSVERALTEKVREPNMSHKCKDHLGNHYISIMKMCKQYGISSRIYYSRAKLGWSLKKILTTPLIKTLPTSKTDHLGNTYQSIDMMCKHYNINTGTYLTRIRSGWSKEKALTTPVKQISQHTK